MTTSQPAWLNLLQSLLQGRHTPVDSTDLGGAQLVVTNPDGSETFRAALARHYRLDTEQSGLLWIRPIVPGAPPPGPGYGTGRIYNLNLNRRRALAVRSVHVSQATIELELTSGQHARVEAASGHQLTELHAWDTFISNTLTAQEEHELDQLDADSWHGRFG